MSPLTKIVPEYGFTKRIEFLLDGKCCSICFSYPYLIKMKSALTTISQWVFCIWPPILLTVELKQIHVLTNLLQWQQRLWSIISNAYITIQSYKNMLPVLIPAILIIDFSIFFYNQLKLFSCLLQNITLKDKHYTLFNSQYRTSYDFVYLRLQTTFTSMLAVPSLFS